VFEVDAADFTFVVRVQRLELDFQVSDRIRQVAVGLGALVQLDLRYFY